MSETEYHQTETNRVRQVSKRGIYDQATVFRILDACFVGNVGFNTDDGPCIIPMLLARRDDELLFHGSTKSRLMRLLASGQKICVSATMLDGLVMAKSLFHHSMNYRSVTVFGTGSEVTDPEHKMDAFRVISDKTMIGRWDDARKPNDQERKATSIVAVKIESASAKIRSGPPSDEPADRELPVWTGVIPLMQVAKDPINRPDEPQDLPVPQYMRHWLEKANT